LFNQQVELKVFNRAPINFLEPDEVEEDSMTKQSYKDDICHEVKYNPSYQKKSLTYELYIKPFSHGTPATPEQWLKFMAKVKLVIHGNGLDEDGLAWFNVTCSLLKGDAVHIFNDKAVEQKEVNNKLFIKTIKSKIQNEFLTTIM
jgi:hypothetical protein